MQEALVQLRRDPQTAEKLLSSLWRVSNRLICPQAGSDRADEAVEETRPNVRFAASVYVTNATFESKPF